MYLKTLETKIAKIVSDRRAFMGDLVQVVAGLGVIVITLVIVMFLGQTFSNALPINNSSAFYRRFASFSKGTLRTIHFDVHHVHPHRPDTNVRCRVSGISMPIFGVNLSVPRRTGPVRASRPDGQGWRRLNSAPLFPVAA